MRIPEGALAAALRAGCEVTCRWTGGSVTDLSQEFGPGWVFGGWAADEEGWSRAARAAFAGHPEP